ncbi:hypothetical protein DSBG_1300 [Desulfosporosinus sp. BG]|nr:hypothetical protein DSBG_1300 [Desulfosporosinus sp. BG]
MGGGVAEFARMKSTKMPAIWESGCVRNTRHHAKLSSG